MQDRVRGVLYGQAIGDALGLPGEFKSSRWMRNKYGDGDIQYERVGRTVAQWEAGEFSDDTEQALCILDAWIKDGGKLDPMTLAEEFCTWAETNGKGMGNHTWNVLGSGAAYLLNPIAVSEAVWEDSGRQAAPNGAVMRTSVVGILDPSDLDLTERVATRAARTTHFDPRCVAGSVAISVTIAALVNGMSIPDAIAEGVSRGLGYDAEVTQYAGMSLEALKLDEGLVPGGKPRIGYTYKCMGAAFWALREFHRRKDHDDIYCDRFRDVLQRVLMAGGDTDTNGAVAGAMLGAVCGLSQLPEDLVKGLHDRGTLDQRLDALEDLGG